VERVPVQEVPITLGQLLKRIDAVRSGGEAKHFLARGGVRVNGAEERRRGRKLYPGDVVELPGGRRVQVETGAGADEG
jgi:ribosome-associated protein